MNILRVENLEQALRYARQCQDEGEFDLFRGQVQRWPMIPTLLRLPAEQQAAAEQRIDSFLEWIEGTPDVAAMLPTLPSRIAVAQHHGLATELVDVTRDPRIAAFFASHACQPPPEGAESCIYCFRCSSIREAIERVRRKAVEAGFSDVAVELPAYVDIDVSNLWRLQAQQGSFILAPDWIAERPEERAIEHLLKVTCLVFPYSGPLRDIEERWVYPDRKSALEIRLDEFFAQEAVARSQEEARAAGFFVLDSRAAEQLGREIDFTALGFRAEVAELLELHQRGEEAAIFRGGIAPDLHESWSDTHVVGPWAREIDERFHETFTEQTEILIVSSSAELQALEDSCIQQVRALLDAQTLSRAHMVGWRIVDESNAEVPAPCDDEHVFPDSERITAGSWLELAWDGMRALPYDDEELAIAVGRTAAGLAWKGRGEIEWHSDGLMSIELVMHRGLDPVVSVTEVEFRGAIRPDLALLLDPRWQHLVDDPRSLMIVLGRCPFLFDFARWRRLFVVELIPSQVVRNAMSGNSFAIYNPLLPVGVRAH